MRAIVIDSVNKKVYESTFTKGQALPFMQKVVDGYIERALTLEEGDDVYVDEEGLLKRKENFFTVFGAGPFAGNGVVVGHNPKNGESTGATIGLEELRSGVRFLSIEEVMAAIEAGEVL